MTPQIKLALAGGLVIFAIALSLITFPRYSRQATELRVTPTVRATPTVPSPLATRVP